MMRKNVWPSVKHSDIQKLIIIIQLTIFKLNQLPVSIQLTDILMIFKLHNRGWWGCVFDNVLHVRIHHVKKNKIFSVGIFKAKRRKVSTISRPPLSLKMSHSFLKWRISRWNFTTEASLTKIVTDVISSDKCCNRSSFLSLSFPFLSLFLFLLFPV